MTRDEELDALICAGLGDRQQIHISSTQARKALDSWDKMSVEERKLAFWRGVSPTHRNRTPREVVVIDLRAERQRDSVRKWQRTHRQQMREIRARYNDTHRAKVLKAQKRRDCAASRVCQRLSKRQRLETPIPFRDLLIDCEGR